jgi:hypothetical protein
MLLWFSPGLLRFSLLVVLTSCGALAQNSVPSIPSASPETARERTAAADCFANEKLAVWQKRLNLQDWNISLLVARSTDLKPKTLGNIHWDSEKKTAVIRVLDPADYKMPFNEILQDLEFTVVHELIHLELSPVLTPLQRNDANRREEEHAVNHMADALLKLERAEEAKQAKEKATAVAPATASDQK